MKTLNIDELKKKYAFEIEELRITFIMIKERPLTLTALIIVVALFLIALFGGFIAPYDWVTTDLPNRFIPPSRVHPFGTDDMGRDIFSRIIHGARWTIYASLAGVVGSIALGATLGAISGYFSGKVDEVVMRITDIFLAFPPLILAMVFAAVMGKGMIPIIIALAATWWPRYTRLIRGQALSLRERSFIEAAKASGLGDFRIVFKHIIPNTWSTIIVQGTMDMGLSILTVATLGFIGVGAQPPTPEWGTMVAVGRKYMREYWWAVTFPGIACFIAIMAFNLLGDGLRDILDPRSRR